jgi:ribonuclease P protein component
MKRQHRLRTTDEFRRVREASPRVWPHPLLVLYMAANDLDRPRLGITVSSRVGKAVVRNRVRRRLREAMRARLDRLTPGVDLLLVARPRSAEASWGDLNAALESVLTRAGATRANAGNVL